MSTISQHIAAIRATLPQGVQLICVSKFHPAEAILEAYNAGERDFGESRVQELCAKQPQLPADIRWHFIGHLQINSEAAKIDRIVNILLEVHTANETTKSGFLPEELQVLDLDQYEHLNICGLMTMATNTDDEAEIHRCFRLLNSLADSDPRFAIRSMGMSDDYLLAIQDGSNMIRIGTDIFGARQY